MKKFLLLTVCVAMVTMMLAQTQKGYVKTRGRLDSKGNLIPGDGLKGAVVYIKDHTSVIVRADDGEFSFLVPEKLFCVDSVRKKGYQLVDMDFCYKTRQYTDTPFDILMEIPGQSIEDYMEDFNRINASQQTMINQLRVELKQLKAQNKINEEEYSRRLAEIAEMQSESQKLVSEMAERYSKTDWDRKDDFNRQIGWLILNGELIKADSLIKSKGSMEKRSAELDKLHQANAEVRADLEKSEALEVKTLEDFAADCYNLYEICKLRHDNDSAAYWLEMRASKDTTNVEWQFVAGSFVYSYMADYNKALRYYQLGLLQAIALYGERSSWGAAFYNNIGLVYSDQGDYGKALEYYNKALSIRKSVYGENHPSVATSYNNIGSVYHDQGDYGKALEYYNKALSIRKSVYGENHPDLATSYNNIGLVYHDQGDYDKALEYYNKALSILKSVYGESHPDVATSYNNIGSVYHDQGDYGKALEYYNKALVIWKSVYGENHPDVATIYNNIGSVYHNQGDYGKALEYYNKALSIMKSVYGENHPSVATSYNNIGLVYSDQGDYGKALEYYDKALSIMKSVYGENHPSLATIYNNIGLVYRNQGDYGKALEYYDKALAIWKSVFGKNHPNVAISYNFIGLVYDEQGNYDKALEYYDKALSILKSVFGKNHPVVINFQNSIIILEYKQVVKNNTIHTFNETHCFTATIVEGDTPASHQGMSGEYILLEFGDWNQDSPTSLFDKNDELRGKPKDILVMKDGQIKQYHFENTIGVQLGVKNIGKKEKQRINKAYEEWKKQNRK